MLDKIITGLMMTAGSLLLVGIVWGIIILPAPTPIKLIIFGLILGFIASSVNEIL